MLKLKAGKETEKRPAEAWWSQFLFLVRNLQFIDFEREEITKFIKLWKAIRQSLTWTF